MACETVMVVHKMNDDLHFCPDYSENKKLDEDELGEILELIYCSHGRKRWSSMMLVL